MTMHECLNFVDALHRAKERVLDNPGPWSWPTWEEVHYNLRLNEAAFPRDTRIYNSFNRQFKIAVSRGWAAEGPCQAHCHARHLRLTDGNLGGKRLLELMNDQGCGPHCGQHNPDLRLVARKVA